MPASATSRRPEAGVTAPVGPQQHVAVGFGLMALLLSTITASIEPAHTHASAASYGGSASHSESAYSREPTTGWTSFPEFLRSAFNDRFYDTDSRAYHTMSPNRPAHGVQSWVEAVKLAAGRRVKQSKPDEEEDEETEQTLLPDSESAHSRTLSSTDSLTPLHDDSSVCVCITPHADNAHQEGHGGSSSASHHPGDDESESSVLSSLAQSIVGTAVSFVARVSSPLLLPSPLANDDASALVVATQRMGVSYLPLCPETQCRAAVLTRSFVSALPLYAQQPLRFGEVVCIPYPADASRTLCFTGTFRKPTTSESAGTPRKNQNDNSAELSESSATCENRVDATSNATALMADGQPSARPQAPPFRLFVGQLRKETTTGFVEYLLRDIIGVDLHRDVAHIEMHTSGQGSRSKGCAWVDFHTDDAMQRVLQFHKRLFINDSSMWKSLTADDTTGHNALYEDAAGVAPPHASEEYVVIVDAANSQWLAETSAELAKVSGRGNDVLSRGPIVIEVPQQRPANEAQTKKPASSPNNAAKQRKTAALAGVVDGDAALLQETLSPAIERPPNEDGSDNILSAGTVQAKKSKRRRQRKAGNTNTSTQSIEMSDADKQEGQREAESEEDVSSVCADPPLVAGSNIAITPHRHCQPAFFSLVHGAAAHSCEFTPNFLPFPWRYDPYHPHNPRVFVVSGCAATE